LEEPLDPRIDGLFAQFDAMESRLTGVPGMNPLGETSTSIDQLIVIRQRAAALADEPGLNSTSAWAAVKTHFQTKVMMENPVGASKALKEKLKNISAYMDESERIQTKMWAKRLTDPKYTPRYGEPYDVGAEFFNLQRPELIAEVKHMLISGRNVVGNMHKWNEVRLGHTAKLLNNPSDIPAIIGNKENHEALRILYSKSELETFEALANDLAIFQEGPIARIMARADAAANPAMTFWKANDTNALRGYVAAAGGPDSPQGRAIAGSFYSMILKENSTTIRGMDVLNKGRVANAMAEMRARGWDKILIGEKNAAMLNARGVETALSMMVGSSNMGAGLITASVTQSAIGGALAAPKKAVHGFRKWFSNFMGGRFLVSPTLFKAAGLPNPRYWGSIDGKHLVPPQMSYLKTFAGMVAAARAVAEDDAAAMELSGKYSALDLRHEMDGGSQKVVNISAEEMQPRAAATLPGTSALGLPNLPRQPGGLGGGGAGTPSPAPRAPQPLAGGGMPTGAAQGVPPGPRPKLGPR
jgi:hypothetical protein